MFWRLCFVLLAIPVRILFFFLVLVILTNSSGGGVIVTTIIAVIVWIFTCSRATRIALPLSTFLLLLL